MGTLYLVLSSVLPNPFFVFLHQGAEETQRKMGVQSTVLEGNAMAAEDKRRLDGAGQIVVRRLFFTLFSVVELPPAGLKISIE